GLFLVGNGCLLLFSPKYFLRFYDIWARGDYVGRTASWRNRVAGWEGQVLGLVFVIAGLYVLWSIVRITH
ncbi:MAG: hypothetical protein WA655_15960, partial [Candidatus Korobacteraceae bacterium]